MAYAINHDAPMGGLSSLMAMKGRMGDTELVHMSKPEVDALGAMGKLHVNPETGLPEAFGLKEILPAALGIGAAIFAPYALPGVFGAAGTFGAYGGAVAAGLGTTAGAMITGKSAGDAAMQGVMAGGLSALGTAFSGGAPEVLASDAVGGVGSGGGPAALGADGVPTNPVLANAQGTYAEETMGTPAFGQTAVVTPAPAMPEAIDISQRTVTPLADTPAPAMPKAIDISQRTVTPLAGTRSAPLPDKMPIMQRLGTFTSRGANDIQNFNFDEALSRGLASERAKSISTYALPLAGAYLSQTPEAPEQQAGIKRPAPPSYYGSKVAKGGQRTGSPTSSQNALDIALGRAPNKQQFTPITYEDNPDYEGQQQASIQGGGLTGMMATGGAIRKMAQDLQEKGNNGDIILAHINPKEAKMLKRAGGSGTVNPKTGLLQFEDGDSGAGDWAGSAGADGEGGGGASSSGASGSDGGASGAGDWAGSAGSDGMGGGGASTGGNGAGGDTSGGGGNDGSEDFAGVGGLGENYSYGSPAGPFAGEFDGSGLAGEDKTGMEKSGPSKDGKQGYSKDDIDLEEAKNAPPGPDAPAWQNPDTNYFQNLVSNPLSTAVNIGLSLGAMALNSTPFGGIASLASLGNTVSGVFGGPTAGSATFGGPSTGQQGGLSATSQGQNNQNQQGNPNGPGTATPDVGQSPSMAMAQAPSAPMGGPPDMGLEGGSSGVQPYYPPRVAQGGGLVSLATGGQAKAPQGKQYFEGQVEGNGDGMSDEVPFDIHNSNPNKALLSKDEYVLPADVVSMIGNGSSNAGSEEIDRFVASIRKKAHGVSKQQTQLKGNKGLQSLVA